MTHPDPRSVPDAIGGRYLRENIGPVLDHVSTNHKPVIVTRYGRPCAVIVPVEWVELTDTPRIIGVRDLPAKNGQ
jgi:prevent-host-death family protein